MSTPLVFLHGWGCNALVFDELISEISSCIETPLIFPLTYLNQDAFEDWVCNQVEEIHRKHGPVHLIGWSMGGMIALSQWDRLLNFVSRLSLIATPARFCGPLNQRSERLTQMIESLETNPQRELKRFWRSCAPREWKPPTIEIQPTWLKGGIEYLGDFDVTSEQSTLPTQIPVDIIQGKVDPICLPAASMGLQKTLIQSSYHLLDEGSHVPFAQFPREIAHILLN